MKLFDDNDPFKIVKSLNILGVETTKNGRKVLNEISKYLFKPKKGGKSVCTQKNFDINLDYEHYFPDFLKYGYNLNKDDIDWWEFEKILKAIVKDKNSNMYQVIDFRTYEKPLKSGKTQEDKVHRFRMQMKREYALPEKYQKTGYAFSKMWGYLEKKVGENKE